MKKINVEDLNLKEFKVIRNKYNRISDSGINHGRLMCYYEGIYYKIFHPQYIRRQNFIDAIHINFYCGLVPHLEGLLYQEGEIIGYTMREGKILSPSEYDIHFIPHYMWELLIERIQKTNMIYYDFVPSNIIVDNDNRTFSLIDLESIYKVEDIYLMKEHNAKIKPSRLENILYEKNILKN